MSVIKEPCTIGASKIFWEIFSQIHCFAKTIKNGLIPNMNIIYTDYFGCFLTFCPHLLGQKPWPIFSFHLGDEEPLPCVGWGGSRYGNRRQQGARGWDASRPEPGRTKQLASPIYKGLYTGWWFGTWIYLSIYWEFHHPNWRSHIFQRGRLKPPTSIWIYGISN